MSLCVYELLFIHACVYVCMCEVLIYQFITHLPIQLFIYLHSFIIVFCVLGTGVHTGDTKVKDKCPCLPEALV